MTSLASHIGHMGLMTQCTRLAASGRGIIKFTQPAQQTRLTAPGSRPTVADDSRATSIHPSQQMQLPTAPVHRLPVAAQRQGGIIASYLHKLNPEEEEGLEQLRALMVQPLVEVARQVLRDILLPELQSLCKVGRAGS
jgi:hypothetical protein